MATQELRDLWLGSRGLIVLLAYSLLLSGIGYMAASQSSVNLLDARESTGLVVQLAMAIGTLIALVVSADAISGERERGTLEHLLLTPLSRLDLVIGKLLGATSMWVAAMLIAVPYVIVLARGPGVAVDAVLVLVVAGSLMAAALTGLGLAASAVASSNRASLAFSVVALIVLAAPSQLPASATPSFVDATIVYANPVSAGLRFAGRVLIDQQSWTSQWTLLISPAVAAVGMTLLAVATSRRLELGGSR